MGKPTICIVTAKLISAFVFSTRIVQSLYFQNTKFYASVVFCDCTGRFVADLVGNHNVGFPTRRLISSLHTFMTLSEPETMSDYNVDQNMNRLMTYNLFRDIADIFHTIN